MEPSESSWPQRQDEPPFTQFDIFRHTGLLFPCVRLRNKDILRYIDFPEDIAQGLTEESGYVPVLTELAETLSDEYHFHNRPAEMVNGMFELATAIYSSLKKSD